MADLADPIIPRRWIPSFRRNDWTIEEVVQARVLCGHYDLKLIPNCSATYRDEKARMDIEIIFADGNVWKRQIGSR